jgi:hypothetical protein
LSTAPSALAALREHTEEKLAEQLLQDSENKFRSVVETATDAVVPPIAGAASSSSTRAPSKPSGTTRKTSWAGL